MSDLIVKISSIDEVFPHPDPAVERLEMVKIKGWFCMVRKGIYKPEDLCLYVPVDSVLPDKLVDKLFATAKIRPDNGRIKSIKFRGAVSQGLIVGLQDVSEYLSDGMNSPKKPEEFKEGQDLAEVLGITKYEPPASAVPREMRGKAVSKKNPNFKEYTDINHLKWNPDAFKRNELVYITEKLHGTSARYGCLPTHIGLNPFKKILGAVGLLPSHEFVYGSRRVQLDLKLIYDGFYGGPLASLKRAFNLARRGQFANAMQSLKQDSEVAVGNVYSKVLKKYGLKDILKPGEVVYGEIVGPGIQKGYTYGVKQGDVEFYAYDVMVNGEYLSPVDFLKFCTSRNIPHVPVLTKTGQALSNEEVAWCVRDNATESQRLKALNFYSPELIDLVRTGDSTVGGQKVREGVVVKPYRERNSPTMGRVVVKVINDDYYLAKDNTDFH